MDTLDERTTTLYRIQKTIMQMLNDRGYIVADHELNTSKEQFIDKYGEYVKRDDLSTQRTKRDDSSEHIYVFFPKDPKVDVNAIKNYEKMMEKENVTRALLVVQQKLTPPAKRHIIDAELLVNITEHVLVPKHQLLTDEEKKTLLQRYTVKEIELPRIQMNDPVARYHGLKRGQVVKIIRPSESAGRYVIYRYVV